MQNLLLVSGQINVDDNGFVRFTKVHARQERVICEQGRAKNGVEHVFDGACAHERRYADLFITEVLSGSWLDVLSMLLSMFLAPKK